jgi:hypothetical protein
MSDIGGPVDPDDPFGSAVPPELEIEEGGLTRRPLVSAAGSGYQWELEEIEGPGTARLSVEVGELAPMAPDELPTNALAPLELVVAGIRQGTARWRVRLVRPWMREAPLVDKVVEVVVHDRWTVTTRD